MSDPAGTSELLLRAVRKLESKVDKLAKALGVEVEGSSEEEEVKWEVIEGETGSSLPLNKTHQAEEGPPDTPKACLDLARVRLGQNPRVTTDSRAHLAFRAGFWIQIAILTHTDYKHSHKVDLPSSQWICFRGEGFSFPVRAAKKRDIVRALLRLDQSTILVGFPSLTELEICCCGAGLAVPPLIGWTSN